MKEGAEMQNPNKLIATVIGITVAALCAGALLGGAWWGQMELRATPAKFKIGDCFRASPPLHRWEPADGQVFNVDATDYLVVYALQLKSRYAIEPAYVGAERLIGQFDEQNEVAQCPYKW
jgi:hypothetical protein